MGCANSRPQEDQEFEENKQTISRPEINQNDAIILKVKLQRDKIMMSRNDLQRRVDANMVKIKGLVREKRKDEAIYYLGIKKSLQARLKNVSSKLDFIEQRIQKIEEVQDDAEFTSIIKQSNDVLNNLMNQVNVDALREANELDQRVNLQNQEIMQIISQNEQDPDIMAEFEKLGGDASVVRTPQTQTTTQYQSGVGSQRNVNQVAQPTRTVQPARQEQDLFFA